VSKYADQDHGTSGLIHPMQILDQHAGINSPHVVVISMVKNVIGCRHTGGEQCGKSGENRR